MRRRERTLTKGRWRAIALSVLLHGGLVAAAVYGWFSWKHRAPPVATVAIEATVVDERALKGIAPPPTPKPPTPEPEPEPAPEPAPEPPPPEEQGPPKPDPAEIERKQEEERQAQEKLQQEKLEQQKLEQEKLENEKKEQERRDAEVARAAAAKAAADKAAADKKAAEKKKADEAAAAKKAAEEKARLARQAELQRSLEAEERANALRRGPEGSRWINQIAAKVARAWVRPPSARPGTTCMVSVRQVQGGEVTAVRVISCNVDDAALRESVERAVYNASPLPPPPDPALFQSTLDITFAPE